MATKTLEKNEASLPFAALQLLAPPVRLVSAALWKVMKQRDVMQYGVVEEFVTSACETVPGLLTTRHQGKLSLGLRGRFILELCSQQPDEKEIRTQLGRFRAPAGLSASSGPTAKRDAKIVRTVEGFHSLVETLLTDPEERQQFFEVEFPVDYGSTFEQELEKLLWEFLIRLDQLLPVPNLAQTVSWLSAAPAVLEECAQAASQPQLLKMLLQHETCLGHLETAASLPPNMGDSILDSLSLRLSGKVSSSPPPGSRTASDPSGGERARHETSFITPVIGIMSNEDVPIMAAGGKRAARGGAVTEGNLKFTVVKERRSLKEGGEQAEEEEEEERSALRRRSDGLKRKQPDDSESDEEAGALSMSRSGKWSKSPRDGASRFRRGGRDQRTDESEEDGARTVRNQKRDREVLETRLTQLGVKSLRLPDDPSLCSVLVSCLCSRPRVLLQKLPAARGIPGGSSQRRRSPVKAPTATDDKENRPVLPSVSGSPSRQRRNAETSLLPGDGEDYVADSEDEATKNFKGRLFMKRYYKTKHGTYVPTLREYWKPSMMRRDLTVCSKRRR